MSDVVPEVDDAKEQRAVSRHVLIGRNGSAYSASRLRALVDAERLRPAQGFAWVEAGPDGLMPSGGGDSVNGRQPRSGMVQDTWESVLDMHYATAHGGLWRGDAFAVGSTDPWRPLTDHLPSLAINTVTGMPAHNSEPELLVIGMGDPYGFGDHETGWWGVWRSFDHGRTFHPLDGGPGASRFFGDDVNEIALFDRQRWFVATRSGLYWTRDGGRHFGGNPTADDSQPLDAGNVLDVRILRSNLPTGYVAAITYAIAEVGLRRFYLPASGPPDRGPASHLLELRTANAGANNRPGHIAFDQAVVDGVELVAMSVATADQTLGLHNALKWGSRGASGSWTWRDLVSTGLTTAGQAAQTSYDHVLLIDPTWHNATAQGLLYAGSVHLYSALVKPDGGYLGATQLQSADANFLHTDHHHLAVEPDMSFAHNGGTAQGVYVGNDGGAFYNADRGTGAWSPIGHSPTLLAYHVAIVQNGEHLVVAAGFQDNGSAGATAFLGNPATPLDPVIGPRGWDWSATGGGDGGQVVLCEDPTTAGRTWMFCVENDYVARFRRENTSPTWTRDPSFNLFTPPAKVNFSGTFARAQDASGAWTTVFFGVNKDADGGARLYRCTGALGTLTTSSFAHVPSADGPSRITAMVAAPVAGATGAWTGLWTGHRDGKIHYSADALATRPSWEERTPPGNSRVITALAIDPRDPRVVVATTGGFSDLPARYKTGRVWMYAPDTNQVLRWTDISGRDDADENLPDVPALSVAVMGTEPRRIVVGTDIGTFLTEDDGHTWQRLDLAMGGTSAGRTFRRMPRVPAYGLASPEVPHTGAAPPPKLALGTYGRSLWVLIDLNRYAIAAAPVAIPALHAELDGGFGFVPVGTETHRELVLHNRGGAQIHIDAVTVNGPGWSIDGGTLTAIDLAAGQAERRQVRLQATAEGLTTASVLVTMSTPDQAPIELALSAEVVAAGPGRLAVLGDGLIEFGHIDATGVTRTAKVVVQNVGVGPLRLTSVRVEGDAWDPAMPTSGGFEVVDAPVGPLAPDAQAEIRIRLHTRPEDWSRLEGTLVIEPDSGSARRVPLRGGTELATWAKVLLGGLAVAVGLVIVGGAIYTIAKATERPSPGAG